MPLKHFYLFYYFIIPGQVTTFLTTEGSFCSEMWALLAFFFSISMQSLPSRREFLYLSGRCSTSSIWMVYVFFTCLYCDSGSSLRLQTHWWRIKAAFLAPPHNSRSHCVAGVGGIWWTLSLAICVDGCSSCMLFRAESLKVCLGRMLLA